MVEFNRIFELTKISEMNILLFFSEPSTRGVLVSLSFISATLGTFLGFFLNTLMPWRTLALVSLTWPILTALAICFVSVQSSISRFNFGFFLFNLDLMY